MVVIQEERVGAEGKFEEPCAGDLVAHIEAGVAFFGAEILIVLRDDRGIAADGGGVINGVRIGIGCAEALRQCCRRLLRLIVSERSGASRMPSESS